MERPAGLLAIGGGVLLAIIGLRGTQHAVFPGLFPGGPKDTVSEAASDAVAGAQAGATPPVVPPIVTDPIKTLFPFL